VPSSSRIFKYKFPFGKAACATRAVSSGTLGIGSDLSDIKNHSPFLFFENDKSYLLNSPTVSVCGNLPKSKQSIAIIAVLITSATLITTVKIALILKYLDLFLK
jgi:hypothetical protein